MSRPDVASGQGGHPGANPFLPEWEYVPDGEPHVFGDRVYLYGSHDRFGAPIFCVGDYVCWSAPVDDLTAWREEGVIYRRGQDPANRLGLRLLFAPDVARGAGVVEVSDDAGFSRLLGTVDVAAAGRTWADFAAPLEPAGPRCPLYLRHRGCGHVDLLEFELLT